MNQRPIQSETTSPFGSHSSKWTIKRTSTIVNFSSPLKNLLTSHGSLVPPYIPERGPQPTRLLRSTGNALLSVPGLGKGHSQQGGPSFKNNLPIDIRKAPTFKAFMKSLKSHLLCEAFGH
ncbi:hypothetical protein FKM82_013018 [Ascaphus truei]